MITSNLKVFSSNRNQLLIFSGIFNSFSPQSILPEIAISQTCGLTSFLTLLIHQKRRSFESLGISGQVSKDIWQIVVLGPRSIGQQFEMHCFVALLGKLQFMLYCLLGRSRSPGRVASIAINLLLSSQINGDIKVQSRPYSKNC